jgi:hypothetical protein
LNSYRANKFAYSPSITDTRSKTLWLYRQKLWCTSPSFFLSSIKAAAAAASQYTEIVSEIQLKLACQEKRKFIYTRETKLIQDLDTCKFWAWINKTKVRTKMIYYIKENEIADKIISI